MDKLQWFKFSPGDWTMGRISKLPIEIQGAYIRLCCIYWNKECQLSVDDAKLELLDIPEAYDQLLRYGIIKHIGATALLKEAGLVEGLIRIDFLDEQFEKIMEQKSKLSIAGKKGAKIKASKGKAKGRLKVAVADKDKDKEESINIYRAFEHLWISKDDYNKLCAEWHKIDVDAILDSIENYKGIDKYKSLYLTARSWLKDRPKIANENGVLDEYAKNVMKQKNK